MPRATAIDTLATYAGSAFKLAVPLLVVPLLARRLDPSSFGLVAVLVSVAMSLSILVELGFGLSATRAAVNASQLERRRIAEQVLGARVAVAACLLAVAALVAWGFGVHALTPGSVMATAALTVATGWTNAWYFQATGQLRRHAAIEVAAMVGGAAIFALAARDVASTLWCYCVLYGLAPALSLVWIHASLGRPSLSTSIVLSGLRMTGSMASFRALTTSYTAAVPALLALVVPLPGVAAFHIADRMVRAFAAPLQPLTLVLYPVQCELQQRDPIVFLRVSSRLLAMAVTSGLVAAALLFLGDDAVMQLFAGAELASSAGDVLRVLCWILAPLYGSTVLGMLWLLPLRDDQFFNRCIAVGAVMGIGLLLTLPAAYGSPGAAWSLLAAEATVFGGMAIRFITATKLHISS
ncbi:oligosaccharide flippase family protein [Caldimonas sp. KR1-144]|uniref:oligosaccharide flippase family protein n=1 Tax=Caldimonas sp. KR1-144 TaxID=3400911 RepID=UPI003C058A15